MSGKTSQTGYNTGNGVRLEMSINTHPEILGKEILQKRNLKTILRI